MTIVIAILTTLAILAGILYLYVLLAINEVGLPELDFETYRQQGQNLKIMALFPHPDDETMSVGGTLAKFASRPNVEVNVVTYTRGEAWQINSGYDPEGLNEARKNGADLDTDLRRHEWLAALKALGVEQGSMLEFPDGLMEAHQEQVAAKTEELIKDYQPDILITYDRSGLYGHPDHVVLSEVVTVLAKKKFPQIKLFYTTLPGRLIARLNLPLHMAKDQNSVAQSKPVYKISFWRHTIQKVRAIRAHESQKPLSLFEQFVVLIAGGIEYFSEPNLDIKD